jgi:hypothetical protein
MAERPDDLDPEVEQSGRQPHDDALGGGGLTSASGDLLGPADAYGTRPFVPAETREMSDPLHQGLLTQASRDASAEHRRTVEEAAREAPGAGEGADASIAGSGQLTTERASGLSGLQGQVGPMGGSLTPQPGTGQGAGATELASREGGYGGPHGLDPDDSAYRMTDATDDAARRMILDPPDGSSEREPHEPDVSDRQDAPDRF